MMLTLLAATAISTVSLQRAGGYELPSSAMIACVFNDKATRMASAKRPLFLLQIRPAGEDNRFEVKYAGTEGFIKIEAIKYLGVHFNDISGPGEFSFSSESGDAPSYEVGLRWEKFNPEDHNGRLPLKLTISDDKNGTQTPDAKCFLMANEYSDSDFAKMVEGVFSK